mmetsp:Transcript_19183/g.59139  ORF Transcript_19183/g.59139 Transcript_19183/m.59139 type:complete len:202 (-) Transcript_19183:1802-2407(-)
MEEEEGTRALARRTSLRWSARRRWTVARTSALERPQQRWCQRMAAGRTTTAPLLRLDDVEDCLRSGRASSVGLRSGSTSPPTKASVSSKPGPLHWTWRARLRAAWALSSASRPRLVLARKTVRGAELRVAAKSAKLSSGAGGERGTRRRRGSERPKRARSASQPVQVVVSRRSSARRIECSIWKIDSNKPPTAYFCARDQA